MESYLCVVSTTCPWRAVSIICLSQKTTPVRLWPPAPSKPLNSRSPLIVEVTYCQCHTQIVKVRSRFLTLTVHDLLASFNTHNNDLFFETIITLGFCNINLFSFFSYLLYFLGWFLPWGSIIWLLQILPSIQHIVLISFKTWNMLMNPELMFQPGILLWTQVCISRIVPVQHRCLSGILCNISKSELINSP